MKTLDNRVQRLLDAHPGVYHRGKTQTLKTLIYVMVHPCLRLTSIQIYVPPVYYQQYDSMILLSIYELQSCCPLF